MNQRKKLEGLYQAGRITRREFVTGLSALGLAAAFSPAFLSTRAGAATKPKKGGRLRIGISGGSTTDVLDPAPGMGIMAGFLQFGLLRNCLVEIDADGKPIPELAESWQSSPDAVSWTFNIRKGVEFHNGKSLTAEDVVWSINHHRSEKSKSAAKAYVKPFKEVKAVGKHQVVIRLESPNADLPYILSLFRLQIFPKDTTDFSTGIGTGGYILQSFEPGVRALVKRNPNYWKTGRAHFDEVELLGIGDVATRTNALKTGQTDVMDDPDRKTVKLLERGKNIQVVETAGKYHFSIPMRTDLAPYSDNNVRLALKYGIDRQKVLDLVLRGYGSLGNDQPISGSYRYYNPNLPQRHYDPDRARHYLKKANLDGNEFTLHTADIFEGCTDTATLFKESAAKAGINIKLAREPKDGWWKNVWKKKAFAFCYWVGRPTEDLMFTIAYSGESRHNDTKWQNERFNNLLKAARSELNDDKRRQMYWEMQRIVSDQAGTIIPVFASYLLAASSKLQHGKVATNLPLDGFRLAERWWFA